MTSVIGSESVSAFLRSSSNIFETALPVLASPNCSMLQLGVRLLGGGGGGEDRVDLVLRLLGVALDLEVTTDRVAVARDLARRCPWRRGTGCW